MIYASAASVGGAVVDATALNLRSEPSLQSSILTTASSGAAVTVYENPGNGWYGVNYGGVSGYMSSEYLSFSEELNTELGTGSVNGTEVRLRDGAGYSAGTLGYYNSGTSLSITGVSREWLKVSVNGVSGYMHSDYITLTGSVSTSGESASTSIGQTVVDNSYQYLNVPYVWAGTSPRGFDCSGLVYYVFTELGYKVNRTAASLYQNGTAVERANLVPGDIICFSNGSYSYIGHVGIYVGNNNFIHASSGTGYVIVSSLSENYYNNHYYGARRIAA